MIKRYKLLGLILVIGLITSFLTGCLSFASGNEIDGNKGEVLPPLNADDGKDDEVGYEIAFESNVVSISVPSVKTAKLEKFPNDPTRSGYIFAGWFFDNNNFTERVELPYYPTKNVTFYAKWLVSGTISVKTYDDFKKMNEYLVGNYILESDIYLPKDYTPIGKTDIPFVGSLDGNGYTIHNLNLEPETMDTENMSQNSLGLFASLKGDVTNLKIADAKITLRGDLFNFNIGLLCGQLVSGRITNVVTNGEIINPEIIYEDGFLDDFVGSYAKPTKNSYFGGIVGVMDDGNLSRCNSVVKIISETNEEKVYLGGLVGHLKKGQISDSFAYATIKGKIAGGLVGYNNGNIVRSYATVDLVGSLLYPSVLGGIAAYNYSNSSINLSYALGNIEGKTVGGLVGVNERRLSTDTGANITNSFADVALYGSEYAGGLVARVKSGEIKNCLAYGKVEADNGIWKQDPNFPNDPSKLIKVYNSHYPTFAGGLVAESWEGYFENCVAFGIVTAISLNSSLTYNVAYATNGLGLSSNLVKGVYGASTQYVKRNNSDYNVGGDAFNSSPILINTQLNSYSFWTGTLKFSDTVWNLVGISVEEKIFPTLK